MKNNFLEIDSNNNSLKENIEIGQGIMGLEFGMSRKDVKKKLGKPDEIEIFPPEEEDDGKSEVWHYDDLELSVSFDEIEEWTLTTLAVSSPNYLFEGIHLIGLSLEETMQQMELLDVGEFVLMDVNQDDDDEEEVDSQVATLFHAGVNLWFENGITSEIQWGSIWEEEEDIPKKKKKKKKQEEPKYPSSADFDYF